MTETTGYRSKEQVLYDLAKAYPFTPEALEENRKGRLAADQFKHQFSKCSRPAIMAVACMIAPFLIWTAMTAGRQHVSWLAAFPIFINSLIHLGETLDAQGKISTIVMVGTTVGGVGFGFYMLSRISTALYFDLLERRVISRESRIVGREEQIMRPNGRDPIERYFFGSKSGYYEVSLAAFRALETGSVYILYLLPRSDVLISLEPKVTAK